MHDFHRRTGQVSGLLLLITLSALGAACSPVTSQPTSGAAQGLRRYQTASPTPTGQAATPGPQATLPPAPSPTPFLYEVLEGDTLLGIGIRYNVSVEELLAANPGVDPRFLSVGTELIIPLEGIGGGEALPTATPVPVGEVDPACTPTAAGGLWCFLPIENDGEAALENLTALVLLYSAQGEVVASGEASAPLNVLEPGEAVPLVAYFEPPLQAWERAEAQVLTALAVPADDQRYLPASAQEVQVEIDERGLQAEVTGAVVLEKEDTQAGLVWVVAVAYDAAGQVVGVRRWEAEGEFTSGAPVPFELEVFSLGGGIERVEVLVEARP